MTGVDGSADTAPVRRDRERDAWAVLASASGMGPATFANLIRAMGSARVVLEVARRPTGAEDLRAAVAAAASTGSSTAGRPPRSLDAELASGIADVARDEAAILARMAAIDVCALTIEDGAYPARLLAIDHPPPLLFIRGDVAALAADRSVAIVGTRRPTEAGRRLAADIAAAVSRAGGVVISGLAVGIDGSAHAAAVGLQLPTVAVIGSGHGRLYPAAHARLAAEIVATGGCVVSELAPDARGAAWTFPQRNRIISGLADATVVVEAPRGSGALITADRALAQGRECFLVPGPVGSRAHEGSLRYLRGYHGQARIVASVPLLLEDLGFAGPGLPPEEAVRVTLGETEARVAAAIRSGCATVDALASATGLATATLLSTLTLLEMRGLVTAAYGRYRPRGDLAPEGGEPRPRRRRTVPDPA